MTASPVPAHGSRSWLAPAGSRGNEGRTRDFVESPRKDSVRWGSYTPSGAGVGLDDAPGQGFDSDGAGDFSDARAASSVIMQQERPSRGGLGSDSARERGVELFETAARRMQTRRRQESLEGTPKPRRAFSVGRLRHHLLGRLHSSPSRD
jgi:hypothetical protein